MNLNRAQLSKLPSPITTTVGITVREDDEFINLMNTIIESNYQHSNFCVPELAGFMNMSISQLTRKAFELTGHTPAKLILNYRLAKACNLLLKSNEPVKSIAWLTGFHAQASFCRCFLKAYKINPSKCRETQSAEQHFATHWKIPMNMQEVKVLFHHSRQYHWLHKLLNFALAENDNQTESMPQLAKSLNTTPSTLNRKLKELYPITSAKLIRDLRLQYASELLPDSSTITEVAIAAGFFDHSHFCHCFKTVFGTFPSVFKLKNSGEMPVSWLKGKLMEKL